MGNKGHDFPQKEQSSTSSVLNLSLEESKKSIKTQKFYNLDILEELRKEVDLPIENEYEESSELLFEGKEEECKMKIFFENKNKNIETNLRKRSKSFIKNDTVKNTPKLHPKESNENISPLKLNTKSFGKANWDKQPNSVIFEFQKELIDCKSCNDDENLNDLLFSDDETERTTPNVEDLQDLVNCRKKMKIFRNSINSNICKEYENILDSENIFEKRKRNSSIAKKKNFLEKIY